MSLLIKNREGIWIINSRNNSKHKGKSLEKIAETEPSYLTFMWSNSLKYLSDDAINVLDDLMEKYQIPREFRRTNNVPTMNEDE